MNNEFNKTTKTDLYKIDPRNIVVVEGFNCRKNFGDIDKLAEEIKAQGILNPISVIPFKDENGNDKYRLVDGERRYRATMKLINEGVEILRIPALFLSKSMSEEDMLIQQALRNEGEQFTPYEWGLLAKRLMDKCGLTMKEVSEKLGINIGTISRYLGYLELDPRLSELIRDRKISGPNLDRVLNAYNGDEEAAYKEIVKLLKSMEEKGTTKVSLRDCDKNSKTVIFKDSTAIRKGLDKLISYLKEYQTENNCKVQLNIVDMLAQLKDGTLIDEILDKAQKTPVLKEAV